MANLDRITKLKELEDSDIKKLNKTGLIKALKTVITHINNEPKPDSASLTNLVDCAMEKIRNKEGIPKQCITDIASDGIGPPSPFIKAI